MYKDILINGTVSQRFHSNMKALGADKNGNRYSIKKPEKVVGTQQEPWEISKLEWFSMGIVTMMFIEHIIPVLIKGLLDYGNIT